MDIPTLVLEVLGKSTVMGPDLFLPATLTRSNYLVVAKVLECAGGKWNKKAKCHRFEEDAEDRIQMMLATGKVVDAKKEFGFFETPHPVVLRAVAAAGLAAGHDVLEPSAGKGNIARTILLLSSQLGSLDCVEIQPDNVKVLKELLPGACVIEHDFLDITPEPLYDRIVMNPPFGKQADIKHVHHAFGFLRPGGRLVAIMSAGIQFRQDQRTTALKMLLNKNGWKIEPLPEGSFKLSGTNVNTVLVTADAAA